MAAFTDKMQNLAKITDLAKYTEGNFSPKAVAKIFKEVGESPEKLRAVLNLWFVPRFKPSFIPAQDHTLAGLQDLEFLSTWDAPPTQLPYRMFDIATGNLIEHPAIGIMGQYCMLSHRWKGEEITLAYIKKARKKDLERTKEVLKAADGAGADAGRRGIRKNDVQLVLDQCRRDILEQEDIIRALKSEYPDKFNLSRYLEKRLNVKGVKERLESAKRTEAQERSKFGFAKMEQRIFGNLMEQMNEKVDEKMKGKEHEVSIAQWDTGAVSSTSSATVKGQKAVKEVVEEARIALNKAERDLETAENDDKDVRPDDHFFKRHSRLREAVDEMINRLQRWKSAIKLDQSIIQAGHIFNNCLFREHEHRYLWLDTCCIDKRNGSETSESLSLMGAWYANAEFCLVQLDTKYIEADAIQDWELFQKNEKKGEYLPYPKKPIISGFEDVIKLNLDKPEPHIEKPEWSERSWTLQELVMSKVTYYANSEWTQLSRPIESLGYYYYLVPFIELYGFGDTKNIYLNSLKTPLRSWVLQTLPEILESYNIPGKYAELEKHIERVHTSPHSQKENSNTRAKAEGEAGRIKNSLQLIALIDGLGVQFPNDMAMETAASSMAQAVYLAAADLTSEQQYGDKSGSRKLLETIMDSLPTPIPETDTMKEEKARHAINFLLHCLIAETKELILSDRRYIAEFGEVRPLKAWEEGTVHSGFSTQAVMSVSYKRKSTVATDHMYSLMGILGVRFPTFPAEGYSKALSRLLDEILITHNDVSVFNWTGMEMGSPIRGRSMYPSSHKAFSHEGDRGQRYNLLLSAAVMSKLKEITVTYQGVIHMLREVINFVKEKDRKNFPFNWIHKLIEFMNVASFEDLDPELSNAGKIIGYILENCDNPPLTLPSPVKVKDTEKVATAPSGIISSSSSFSLPASIPGFKGSAGKNDSETSSKKGPKFSRLGRGIKQSFGERNSGSAEKGLKAEPASQAPVVAPAVSDDPDEIPESMLSSSWESFDLDVLTHIDDMARPAAVKKKHPSHPLPPAIQEINFHVPRPEIASQAAQKHEFDRMVSPNPIIVTNSGIESIFDIQRIIVTMIDPNALRSKVAKTISPRENISGWCSISTGFARVVTNFSCTKQSLERELDVVEAVENKVLKEQDKEKGRKRGDKILKGLSIARAVTKEEDSEDKKGVTPPDNYKPETEEELLVSRMIDFIQEPQLGLVAGEWVLGRFSSVPGAKWFLCYLELGSTHQFYGHRIATGEIDFHSSTPEPGLVNVWQTYMDRKKGMMCSILNKYLKSKEMAGKGEKKLKEGSEFAKLGIDMAIRELDREPKSPLSPKSPATEKDKEEEEKESEGDDSGDSDDESFLEKMLDQKKLIGKMLDQGKLASKAFGEYTILAGVEKFFEVQANRLDRNLSVSVLKKTPKSLQMAVENMNDAGNLLPAMFHPSIKVHMF